ncbi:MAG: hypothetical protein IKX85_03635, partial [Clostridia bacterium]|nr:hypothetical protein [Clostridia bacterium]
MLKGYRRRFVVLNLALIGAVLLVGLVVLGVFMGRRDAASLRDSMSHAVEPLISPSFIFSPRDDGVEPPAMPEGDAPPGGENFDRPENDGRRIDLVGEESAASLAVLLYGKEDGEISVLSNEIGLSDEEMALAAAEAADREDGFGKVSSGSLIFYKRTQGGDVSIVFASSAQLAGRIWKSALFLCVIFLFSMGLFFLISL